MRLHHRTTRPAFTLTEMLVATALCLFLMVVIGEAVGQATRTFSTLRTAGQLQERNRGAVTTIRRDLGNDHLAGPYPGGRGGPMVGQQRLDIAGWQPPWGGYFEIEEVTQSVFEPGGTAQPIIGDTEGLNSTRANTHRMRFTMRLPAGTPTELFTGRLDTSINGPEIDAIEQQILLDTTKGNAFVTGDTLFYSQWAEVCYFMVPNGENTQATTLAPNGLPLGSLRRRIRVVAPKTTIFQIPVPIATANAFVALNSEIAVRTQPIIGVATHVYIVLMGPDDVAVRVDPLTGLDHRIPYQTTKNPDGTDNGSDILVTDAIGFEIKAAWGSNPRFNTPPLPNDFGYGLGYVGASPAAATMFSLPVPNTDEPYADLPPANPVVAIPRFDTGFRVDGIDWENSFGSPNAVPPVPGFLNVNPPTVVPLVIPYRINVRSIQIKLRIWDAKAEQTRQVSILQEI